MTRDYVLNQLTCELVALTGDTENMSAYRKYLNMALDIGVNHFTKDMEEVIQMDTNGRIIKRYKGITDAATKIGIKQCSISDVITGRQNSTHGFIFRKASSFEKPEHKSNYVTLQPEI